MSTSNYVSFNLFSAYKIIKLMLIDTNNGAYLMLRPVNKVFYNRVSSTVIKQSKKSYTGLII